MTSRDPIPLRPRGSWLAFVAAACAVRVAIPLAALADSGHALPGLPRYDYEPTPGDAQGFYSAARDLMAAWGRIPAPLLVLIAVGLVAAAFAVLRLWRSGRAEWAIVLAAAVVSLAVVAAITQTSRHTGGAVIGWPLVWSAPMLPYRALGLPLDPDVAFGFGLALSLLAIVASTLATWALGLRATRTRAVAGLAVGAFALWPLLSRLAGPGAWENGTWNVDAGLHLYDEPLSTALVAAALVLLLAPRLTPVVLASAGVLLSLAVTVRLSNALIAALVLGLAAWRAGPRRVLPLALGLVTFAPVALAWWPHGYAALFDRPDVWPEDPFSPSHIPAAWTDSLLFTPRLLLMIVPLGIVGVVAVRWAYARALLGGVVAVTAFFYGFYAVTPMHPRFLYVTFPALFTLWAAGVVRVVQRVAPGQR